MSQYQPPWIALCLSLTCHSMLPPLVPGKEVPAAHTSHPGAELKNELWSLAAVILVFTVTCFWTLFRLRNELHSKRATLHA